MDMVAVFKKIFSFFLLKKNESTATYEYFKVNWEAEEHIIKRKKKKNANR
jgi:hypothetical protein|tara:strand:- start:534 stop:683 length:150 start_codon:yes stop_codon:yes gene_type:complete